MIALPNKKQQRPTHGDTAMPTDFDSGLARNAANFVPLTPLEFLARAADVLQHLEPTQVGQQQVERDRIEAADLARRNRVGPARHSLRAVAGGPQRAHHREHGGSKDD